MSPSRLLVLLALVATAVFLPLGLCDDGRFSGANSIEELQQVNNPLCRVVLRILTEFANELADDIPPPPPSWLPPTT